MYDDISIFLDSHNSFGFHQDTFRKSDPAYASWIQDVVPSLVSDHGTPTSVSLIMPTEPLVMFSPPVQHSIHQPFASGSWLPTNSDRISFHHDLLPNAGVNSSSGAPGAINESSGREFHFHRGQEDAKGSTTNHKGHSQ